MWKRKLEEEAVEAVKFLWKRKHFSLKKETESGSKLGSDELYTELEAEAKNILLFPHPCLEPALFFFIKSVTFGT